MGFGIGSSEILGTILRKCKGLTHLDLTLNRLGNNLKPLVDGIKVNTRIVSLKLSNNEIVGSQDSEILK
jgi:Ran GTPase-activating protein (RanGAP) involved in mRNA processing and transport